MPESTRHEPFRPRPRVAWRAWLLGAGLAGWAVLAPLTGAFADSPGDAGNRNRPEDGAVRAAPAAEDLRAVDLSPQERRRAVDRAREEIGWWRTIRAPRDPDARFAYMQRMLRSLRFFHEHQLEAYLHLAIEQQAALREDEPAFCTLAGLVTAHGPTLEAYDEALRYLRRALRLDAEFSFARFADGLVRLRRQEGRVAAGHELDAGDVHRAVANLERVHERRPQLAEARRLLAVGQLLLGEPRAAQPHVDAALALEPNETPTWSVCVKALRESSPSDLVAEIERRLRRHEEALRPAMRLHVYGLLADEHMRREAYARAYDLLVLEALPVAHGHADELTAAQWRRLYADAARAAAQKAPSELTMAFAFLDAAIQHCRQQRLRLYPLVEPYETLVGVQVRHARGPEPVRERVRGLVELLFDVVAHDALNDGEMRALVDTLTRMLRGPGAEIDELPLERPRLWSLARWLFERHEATREAGLFELGLVSLRALLPVAPERDQEQFTERELEGASRADLRDVQAALIAHGISSADEALRLDAAHILGRLLRTTEGDERRAFVAAARRTLEGPASAGGVTRMIGVCEVLRLYPVTELREPLLAAMTRVLEVGESASCRRLFAAAHTALNAGQPQKREPDWRPEAATGSAEYARILRLWRETHGGDEGAGR